MSTTAKSVLVAAFALATSAANSQVEMFNDQNLFETGVSGIGSLQIQTFDTVPTSTVLVGNELGDFTIAARQISVVDPQDFAPGLGVGGLNVNSQPNGISASLVYSGVSVVSDNLDDDFLLTFETPTPAAGLWIGNLGATNPDFDTTTTVEFLNQSGAAIAQFELTQASAGLIGSGVNNRIFAGVVADESISAVRVSNAAADQDSILLDDVQYVIAFPACAADTNGDGVLNDSDFFAWVTAFTADPRSPEQETACDVNRDGSCNDSDFFAWVTFFTGAGCPGV
ncbi:MAG: dockerin type I domain-containing protein [Planctomycetota bacterium]